MAQDAVVRHEPVRSVIGIALPHVRANVVLTVVAALAFGGLPTGVPLALRVSQWRPAFAWLAYCPAACTRPNCLLPLLAFVPASAAAAAAMIARSVAAQVQRLFSRYAADSARRSRTRRDWLLSVSLHAFAPHLYGPRWPVPVVPAYLRGLWLSVADNLPHYRVVPDECGRAHDFRAPPGFGVLLMNYPLHRQHPLQPTLPWTALPSFACETDKAIPVTRPGHFRVAQRQFGSLMRED